MGYCFEEQGHALQLYEAASRLEECIPARSQRSALPRLRETMTTVFDRAPRLEGAGRGGDCSNWVPTASRRRAASGGVLLARLEAPAAAILSRFAAGSYTPDRRESSSTKSAIFVGPAVR